jgi:HEAT repeat protein
VRVAAAKALEYIGGDRAVAAFKDSEWGAAVAVVKAIVDANGAGIDPLVAALEDDKVTVREAAIRVLGQMKDPRAIEPLISTLKDSEVGVRVAAVEALGQMKDPQAVKLSVVALLQYESLLGPLSRAELKAVQRVFLNIGSPAVNPLVEGLKGSNAKVYIAAAHTLGLLKDPRAIDPLLVALGDKKERVRDSRDTVEWWQMHEAAMRALGQIRDPRAVDALLAAFKDKDRSVHGPAAVALGQTRDSRVVDALLAAFKDKDGSMRGPAAAALGQTQDPRAVDALLAALTDQNSYTRAMAAGALDQIEDVRVVDALITTMKDSDSSVRAAAAWSLGCIGDDRAMTALASAMPDPEVGAGIGNALVRLGWQPQAARDEVYLWICRKQQDELLRTWEVTCRVLFEDMLSSEEKRVDNAVFTFISLGREEVIPKLVSVLNEHGNKAMALTYLTEFSKSKDTMALPTAILHVR